MSPTLLYATIAIVVSTVILCPLALRDPKRLRAAAEIVAPLSRAQRRALGWAALAPGIVLMLGGHWPAFLIWFGGAAAIGWVFAQAFAPRKNRHPR